MLSFNSNKFGYSTDTIIMTWNLGVDRRNKIEKNSPNLIFLVEGCTKETSVHIILNEISKYIY